MHGQQGFACLIVWYLTAHKGGYDHGATCFIMMQKLYASVTNLLVLLALLYLNEAKVTANCPSPKWQVNILLVPVEKYTTGIYIKRTP